MNLFRGLRLGALTGALLLIPSAAQAAESLISALTSAYLNNPSIMSALLNVYSTAENIVVAKSAKLPSIGATATATQGYSFDSPFTIDPTVNIGLSYSQRLYDGSKSDADIEAARALTELSRYSLQNSEQNVLLAVVQAYMGVIRDTQLVQLRQENISFFQKQVDSANDRLNVGEGTKIDVSQAEARLAQGTAAYQSAISSLANSRASYERYVGHKPQGLSGEVPKLSNLIPKSVDAAVAEGTTSHPAVRMARASIRAAQASSESAAAAFAPTLDFIASIGSTVIGASPPQSSPVPSGSFRLSLTVPIYSGGRNGANLRKANINEIKSEVDALAARDQIQEAVISAWSAYQNAAAQISAAESGVSAGELALQGVIEQRDVGQLTTLDVLNAQSELTSVREGLIQARAGRVIALFALISATGHLTAADLGLKVPIKTGEGYISTVEDVWQELSAIDFTE
ncbi:MAG TPA: TolC family outer membrane protein [Devosia sp.]|nr:TolC family outer membrane protein [Devosia sp.]